MKEKKEKKRKGDGKVRGQRVRRLFVLRLTNKADTNELQEFQMKSTFLGIPPQESLLVAVKRFNLENQVGCTLVSEADMLSALSKAKMRMTRQTLFRLKKSHCPTGWGFDGTVKLWASDGNGVVYNKEGMLAFVKEARK